MIRNLGVAASLLFEIFLFSEIKNSDLAGVFIKKMKKKNRKYGSNFPPQTFSKTVDREVKKKETLGEF